MRQHGQDALQDPFVQRPELGEAASVAQHPRQGLSTCDVRVEHVQHRHVTRLCRLLQQEASCFQECGHRFRKQLQLGWSRQPSSLGEAAPVVLFPHSSRVFMYLSMALFSHATLQSWHCS